MFQYDALELRILPYALRSRIVCILLLHERRQHGSRDEVGEQAIGCHV